jgi:hypothetical protein
MKVSRAFQRFTASRRPSVSKRMPENPNGSAKKKIGGTRVLAIDPFLGVAVSNLPRQGPARPAAVFGIFDHSRPSSRRSPDVLRRPLHCLKKKATPASKHSSRSSVSHGSLTGRCCGPDSPPAISQSIPVRSKPSNRPSSGSADLNRTEAGISRRRSARWMKRRFSTETPIHAFAGQGRSGASWARRSSRLVKT